MKDKFFSLLKNALNDLYEVAIQEKSVRAGRGKSRGRKYKKSSGLLLVIGKDEEFKLNGVDVVRSNDLLVSDFGKSGGRLTIYTEKAVSDLGKLEEIKK